MDIEALDREYVLHTYARNYTSFVRGEGAKLYDENGSEFIDFASGIGVNSVGHARPELVKAVCDQAGKLLHTSNLQVIEPQARLAKRIVELSGYDMRCFFGNSGAEANEAAIKIVRLYGHQQNITNPCILVMHNSFHGRTLATLSATGNSKIQDGFAPLVEGFQHIPFDDVEAIHQAIKLNSNIVAIMLEPVQGEGGVRIPARDYLNHVRKICDDHHLLMILDEIQTGIGRTGKLFAYQHNQIIPDVCTLAKGLGNGVPIGACLARGKASTLLTAGKHGSTFGGNPLACHTASAVLDTLRHEAIIEQVEAKGSQICSQLRTALKDNPAVSNIRNKGLMIGIDLAMPCAELVGLAQEQGLLINVTAEKTIRLLPPLIITSEQIEFLTEQLAELIRAFTT